MIRSLLKVFVLAFLALQGRAGAVDFETQIRPLLKEHCVKCHGPMKQASGLRLDAKAFALRGGDSGLAIVAGKSVQSSLWQRIVSHDDNERMPPEGKSLSAEQQELIKQWIDAGAMWLETDEDKAAAQDSRLSHWAWQPLRRIVPPDLALNLPATSTPNQIDLFLTDKLNQQQLSYSPQADRRTLIRRLSFDLLGLPPTPEQLRAFESDESPRAYEQLVDRMLDSPHYGERAAQHWLDIAHYADTHGFERDQIREHAWRYRDWVIDAFNRDMRFDEFVRKQIAGDAINADDPQSVIATGFLAAGPWDFVGQAETPSPVLKRLARADDLDDMVTQVMAATMAVTVNCARCHDHKLDPIAQREYYSICSVFAGTKRGHRSTSTAAEKETSEAKITYTKQIEALKQKMRELRSKGWSLADIVGGGNGLGTGQAGAGIDTASGNAIKEARGFLEGATPNRYVNSPLSIVDGVAIPSGQASDGIVISSTGLRAMGIPSTSGKAWDAIRNGPVNSQFSTKLGNVDYNDSEHTLLSLHANALVTFDLQELPVIPSLAFDANATRILKGSSGYFGQTPKAGASVFVLVDGKIHYQRERIGRDDGLQTLELTLPADARFLTLLATDNGNDISHDQICFVDLRIEPTAFKDTEDRDKQTQLTELKQQVDALTAKLNSLPAIDQVYGVISEPPPSVALLARGDTEQPREEVQPSALNCVVGLKNFSLPASASDPERRLKLAEWVTSEDNPLLSRVIVNRLWQQHFGVGIVATPSDFGLGGSLPSHPELLDWLASELKQRQYSLKAMHRLICCSAAYRQQSILKRETVWQNKAEEMDASNRLLWRQNSRRLDAESLRDSVLAVSGQLEPKMYGPGFREFDYKEEYAPVYSYVTKADSLQFRRSIYRFRVRTTPNPWLTVLDCPNSANLTPTRNTTTTALQSLALLNHEFLLQQAEYFAKRLEQAERESESRVRLAWQLCFGRDPQASERQAAMGLIGKHGLATFCRYLLNANEFVAID